MSNNLIRLSIVLFFILIVILISHLSLITNLSTNKFVNIYLILSLLKVLLKHVNKLNESFLRCFLWIRMLNLYENVLLIYSLISMINSYILIKYFNLFGILFINLLNLLIEFLLNKYVIENYFYRNQSKRIYSFSSYYILFLLISILIIKFHLNLIETSFEQLCFSIGFLMIIISLTFIEEKELIHYLFCVYKLNHQKTN